MVFSNNPKARSYIYMVIFLGPALLLILVFWILPVFSTIFLSFTNMGMRKANWEWVYLENYMFVGAHPFSQKIAINTLIYVAATLAFNVLVGLLLAILTFYMDDRTSLVYRALWLLPRASPPVVYGLLWLWVLDASEYGLLNQLLAPISDKPTPWLVNYAMPSIVVVNGFIGASFSLIVFSSALKAIPPDYLMAARVDGASELRIVKDVILPLMKWPIMFVTAWQTLSLLASYEYILIVTNGGPFFETEVWSLFAYHQAFQHLELGFGAALAMILVIIALIVVIIQMRLFRFKEMITPVKIEHT